MGIKIHCNKYKRFFVKKRRVIVDQLIKRIETSEPKEEHHKVTVIIINIDNFIIKLLMTNVMDPELVDILLWNWQRLMLDNDV